MVLSSSTFAQQFDLLNGQARVNIPFELRNNFIVVDIIVNKRIPLKFIFDTGAEYTIISSPEAADLLDLEYARVFTIYGADLSTPLTANLVRKVRLQLGTAIAPFQDIFVLEEDYFQFSQFIGSHIHGILGASFFRQFVVEINYERRQLILHNPEHFRKSSKSSTYPVEIKNSKPYITLPTLITPDTTHQLKFLIDTGAGLGLLLHQDSSAKISLPTHTVPGPVGVGLGGMMLGQIGRIHKLLLPPLQLDEVLTHYQRLDTILDKDLFNDRNGIIGSLLLQRFRVTIDYPKSRLYLQPSKKYNSSFRFDRSGLMLTAGGAYLNEYLITYIRLGSPADATGLRIGDEILSMNGLPPRLRGLWGINKLLSSPKDKTIKLKVRRNKQKFKVRFQLRDLL